MEALEQTRPTVSELVRTDYRAADVFRKWGINYCCGGNLPLEEACRIKGVDPEAVASDLRQARQNRSLSPAIDYYSWPVPFLIDYLLNIHHAYVRDAGQPLATQLTGFVQGHLKKFPDLAEVDEAFQNLLALQLEHQQEEEERIFPYLRQVASAHTNKESYGKLFVRTLGKSLAQVNGDHQRIASALQQLRKLTGNYRYPEKACTNYQVLFHKLREFDEDLVQHKHLENNVLFPRVREMEAALLSL